VNKELPGTADVAIVGGGAIGCSLAYYLARGGLRAVVLEREALGSGSTSRCAGGVRQQFSTEVNIRLGQRSIAILRALPQEVGFDPAYRPIGYLLLATTEARGEALEAEVALQRHLGVETELVVKSAAAELVPGMSVDDVVVASYCQSDGIAGPSEVTIGYASAARRLGAVILEDAEVTEIETSHESVVGIHCRRGFISCKLVVICAGPQARAVGRLVGLDVSVSPVRHHVWLTSAFDGQPHNTPVTVDLVSTFYFHPEGPGLMVGMGNPYEPEGENLSVDWSSLPPLIEEAARRLPAIGQASVVTGWAGLYEMTPDNQPLVGPTDIDGLWLACGFSGHGFMMAPGLGESLACLLLGSSPIVDLSSFSPSRFSEGWTNAETVVI
jgi:sarcosine oxidase subunit beta